MSMAPGGGMGTDRKLVIVAAMAGTFLSALDSSIVGPAMPTIIGQLGGLSFYSWVFSGYLLTSTTTVPLYGRLSDMYGRKPMFIASAVLFVLGSVLCGLSQNMAQLVAFRAIQGIGAGGVVPVTFTILGDLFTVEERAKITGLFSAVWGGSAVAGPTLGGLIVQVMDWRWVFYINLPFGVLSVYLMWRYLHETGETKRSRIDYLGATLLTFSVAAMMFGLLEIGEGTTLLALQTGGLFILSAALMAWFVLHEHTFESPMIPLTLLRSRLISVSTGAGTLIGGMMFGISSFVPLYIQGVHGGSPIQAGLAIAPFSIGWSIASVASGHIIIRAGYRISAVAGVIASVLGCVALLGLSPDSGWLPAAIGSGLVGIGMGLSSTAMLISVQNSVGWGQRGVATSLVQFSRTIGGAIGVAALGTLLTIQMQSRLAGVNATVSNANDVLDATLRASLSPDALRQMTGALAGALHDVYFGMFVVAFLAAAVVVFLFPRGSVEDLQGAENGNEQQKRDTEERSGVQQPSIATEGVD